jgi:hypothetical protein
MVSFASVDKQFAKSVMPVIPHPGDDAVGARDECIAHRPSVATGAAEQKESDQ